jgi:hypothetical protein
MIDKAHPTHDERVRLKAYEIWLNEGRPEGRDARHWEMAREAVGYDDALRSTLQPAGEIAGAAADEGRPAGGPKPNGGTRMAASDPSLRPPKPKGRRKPA